MATTPSTPESPEQKERRRALVSELKRLAEADAPDEQREVIRERLRAEHGYTLRHFAGIECWPYWYWHSGSYHPSLIRGRTRDEARAILLQYHPEFANQRLWIWEHSKGIYHRDGGY